MSSLKDRLFCLPERISGLLTVLWLWTVLYEKVPYTPLLCICP